MPKGRERSESKQSNLVKSRRNSVNRQNSIYSIKNSQICESKTSIEKIPSQTQSIQNDTPRITNPYKHEDPLKRVIDPMSVVNMATKMTTNDKNKNNNILQKTITAVRESLWVELQDVVKTMVQTEVAENNSTLNIQQLLKAPENKMDQVKENIKDLFSKYDILREKSDFNEFTVRNLNESLLNIKTTVKKVEENFNKVASKEDFNNLNVIVQQTVTKTDVENIYTKLKDKTDNF